MTIRMHKKRKGEISFETSPSACPIFEDLIRRSDHNVAIPESSVLRV